MNGESLFNGDNLFCKMNRVLEMNGDDHTTMHLYKIYLVPPNCTLISGQDDKYCVPPILPR